MRPFVTVLQLQRVSLIFSVKLEQRYKHAKDVIFMIDDIEVYRTGNYDFEESITIKKRLMHTTFKNM
jgi:hypothetical protein